MWQCSCQRSSSSCFRLSWEHQKSRLWNGSQYTSSFLPARSPSSFSWRTSGVDTLIFIASPGKFSPRECCSHNSCPVNLVHHTSCPDISSFIHSLPDHIPRSEFGHIQLTRLGTTIFVSISLSEGASHMGETLLIHLMGSSLLLFHTSPLAQLTHKQCCQSVVKEEETDYLLAWNTGSTEETCQGKTYLDLSIQKQKR